MNKGLVFGPVNSRPTMDEFYRSQGKHCQLTGKDCPDMNDDVPFDCRLCNIPKVAALGQLADAVKAIRGI
jgi:hypothetical protein